MTDGPDRAVAIFNGGLNCAQAVFSAYSEAFGVDKTTALRIAAGFGAGMGRRQEVCGAVTGAIMLAGLKHTAKTNNAIESREETLSRVKEETYRSVNQLCEHFKDLHGTINCKELLGCDISTPEGMQQAQQANLFSTRCVSYVRDMAGIIESLLF